MISAVAVIGLLVGGFGVWLAVRASGRENDLSTQVASMSAQMNRQAAKLQQQAAKLQAQQTQLNSTANAESIKGVKQQLTQVNNTLAQYRNCVPELQTELDGLTINYNINWSNPGQDYFNINNGSQISNDCSRVLYPR